MYKINKGENRITPLEKEKFSKLGFKERENLQEWIVGEPSILGGEELLIIQKEFSGFDDTNERLDLLALDKDGSLVIIENKLDDSGKNVVWQALKYASYCSSLSKKVIRTIYQEYLDIHSQGNKAEEKICDFFDIEDYEEIVINKGFTQRVILVAANFRKEVTSTALWLLNFKIRLQCFRAVLYTMDDDQFLSIEQIISIQDTEEYMIGMAEKAQEDIEIQNKHAHNPYRDPTRTKFWTKLLNVMNTKSSLYQNINPSGDYWKGAGSGISGIQYIFTISKQCEMIELYISTSRKENNKLIYDELFKTKDQIENKFNGILEWERKNDTKVSRVCFRIYITFEECNWDEIINVMTDNMVRLNDSLRLPLQNIIDKLKSNQYQDDNQSV